MGRICGGGGARGASVTSRLWIGSLGVKQLAVGGCGTKRRASWRLGFEDIWCELRLDDLDKEF